MQEGFRLIRAIYIMTIQFTNSDSFFLLVNFFLSSSPYNYVTYPNPSGYPYWKKPSSVSAFFPPLHILIQTGKETRFVCLHFLTEKVSHVYILINYIKPIIIRSNFGHPFPSFLIFILCSYQFFCLCVYSCLFFFVCFVLAQNPVVYTELFFMKPEWVPSGKR